jgi:prepilin-type N-terminal cleavage/methylation domain-containing protein
MKTDCSIKPRQKPRRGSTTSGFTLIELLTVIAIIAILAGIAGPPLTRAIRNAQMTKAMGNARGIGMALHALADDNGGAYPDEENSYGQEISSSKDAFRGLFPEYFDTELPFAVKRSAWGPKADGRVDEESEILEPGENHFAYIAGLTTSSRSSYPLIVDGTNGSGSYTDEEGARGGAWGGVKAIVIYNGGNAKLVKLKGEGSERFIPRYEDGEEHLLDVSSYIGENVRLLDPAQG